MKINIHVIILILFVAIFFTLFSTLIHNSAIYMVRKQGQILIQDPSGEFISAIKTIDSFNIISWIIVVVIQICSIFQIIEGIKQKDEKTQFTYAIIFLITCIMYPDGINAMMNINTYDVSIEKRAGIVNIEADANSQMRISFDLAMSVLSVLSMIIIFGIYGSSLTKGYLPN